MGVHCPKVQFSMGECVGIKRLLKLLKREQDFALRGEKRMKHLP